MHTEQVAAWIRWYDGTSGREVCSGFFEEAQEGKAVASDGGVHSGDFRGAQTGSELRSEGLNA